MTDMNIPDLSTLPADLVAFEEVESDRFRSRWHFINGIGSLYGGQIFGQAMAAARRTAPDWPMQHMSGTFISAGRTDHPIDYQVARLRDGKRFASRRVSAFQQGRLLFEALASFHAEEPGPAHQQPIPADTPAPEDLPPLIDFLEENRDRLANPAVLRFLERWPFELRQVDGEGFLTAHQRPPRNHDYWLRLRPEPEGLSPWDHENLFAFLSDFWFAGTGMRRHSPPFAGNFVNSSLNHALWFHAPVSTSDWLLFNVESPVASGAVALTRGLVYDRHGKLVASAAQELLVRPG